MPLRSSRRKPGDKPRLAGGSRPRRSGAILIAGSNRVRSWEKRGREGPGWAMPDCYCPIGRSRHAVRKTCRYAAVRTPRNDISGLAGPVASWSCSFTPRGRFTMLLTGSRSVPLRAGAVNLQQRHGETRRCELRSQRRPYTVRRYASRGMPDQLLSDAQMPRSRRKRSHGADELIARRR